jgi:hypothetical protein
MIFPILPKDVEIIIQTFNCDHRPKMKIALDEMIEIYFPLKSVKYWKAFYKITMKEIPHIGYCLYCNNKLPLFLFNRRFCGLYYFNLNSNDDSEN